MTAVLRQIPNILTAIRIVLAPLTAYLMLHHQYLAALFVFAFAGGSDALDGFLARRFGLVSRFGEYLDPAADKLLMLACFIT
ncbi:MAG: CDP-alcohol phosphatidyltransferase family protein [Rhizomicrobium sp.]